MLTKILLLIVVLAAVWYGFKLIGRRNQARRQGGADDTGAASSTPSASNEASQRSDTIDLVRGEDGKTFVAPDTDRTDKSA